MADLGDVTDRVRIDEVFEKKDPRAFAVNIPGRPPRPSKPGEVVRRIHHQFGIEGEEFKKMGPAELWQYVSIILDRLTDSVKNVKLEKGRPIQFRSFDTPANTTNRRVEVINEDGIFVEIVAQWVGIPRQGRPPQQDVWVTVTAEVADD